MANDSFSQQALAADSRFRLRVRAALSKVAWEVSAEPTNTLGHNVRSNFARLVLQNLDAVTAQICPWLVERTNLLAFTTSYDFVTNSVVTAAGDADIESQLMTDWNFIAGV